MRSRPHFTELLAFNAAVLEQGAQLAHRCLADASGYSQQIGPHLRHVIEHYEALLCGLDAALIDYDQRARERAPEQDPLHAQQRLLAIAQRLRELPADAGARAINVSFRIGLDGSQWCLCPSTLARELQFVASHTIHHYAVLRSSLTALGIAWHPDFGKAPETVRHERQAVAA